MSRSLAFRRIVWASVIAGLVELAIIAFLIGISYAIAYNVVQLPIVVSFGLVELFAFLLARYFLGERQKQRSLIEYMAIVEHLPEYAHLVIHWVDIGFDEGYPNKPLYVVDTISNIAYWVPPYLDELDKAGAMAEVEHDTEEEMYQWFNENKTKIVRGYPMAHNLEAKVPNLAIEYDPNRNSALFSPEIEILLTPQPTASIAIGGAVITSPAHRITRKSLRVEVRNTGKIVAERCTAELKIIETSSPAVRKPSDEPKQLLWETSQEVQQDIGALVGHASLNVLFSDDRLPRIQQETDSQRIMALVATPPSIRMNPVNVIRAQDGFGRGEFVGELIVASKDGSSVVGRFRIRVTDDWKGLSMERIS